MKNGYKIRKRSNANYLFTGSSTSSFGSQVGANTEQFCQKFADNRSSSAQARPS